ncbi:MAG: hypothetical protein R2695_09560 [Acidimicrobiales bacterium]
MIAGMRSFRGPWPAIAHRAADNLFTFNFTRDPSLSTLLVFIAVVAALYWQSRDNNDEGAPSFAPKIRPLPPHAQRIWWIRHMPRLTMGVVLGLILAFTQFNETILGWLGDVWSGAPTEIKASQFFLYGGIAGIAIVASSLTVITGWSGQLSLAQMAYGGIGALSAAAFNRGVELDLGYGSTRILDVHFDGMPVVPAMGCAVLFTAAIAAITGIGALRVRGIMLAVSTFAFAIAAESYIYKRPFFSDGDSSVTFDRGYFLWWDLHDQKRYFYFSLAGLVITTLIIGRLRRSGVGRSIIAVRDNADTASAYSVSPVRMKLTAFAVAGGIAGFGGALLGNGLRLIRFGEAAFQIEDSLKVVNMVVIGGLGSVLGPIIGALWFNGLRAFFPGDPVIGLVSSSIGFLFMLMYFPGGFVQLAYRVRDAAVDRVTRRIEAETAAGMPPPPAPTRPAVATPGTGAGQPEDVHPFERVLGGLAIIAKVVALALIGLAVRPPPGRRRQLLLRDLHGPHVRVGPVGARAARPPPRHALVSDRGARHQGRLHLLPPRRTDRAVPVAVARRALVGARHRGRGEPPTRVLPTLPAPRAAAS